MSQWNFNLNKSHHVGEDLPEPFGYNKNFSAEVKMIKLIFSFKTNETGHRK